MLRSLSFILGTSICALSLVACAAGQDDGATSSSGGAGPGSGGAGPGSGGSTTSSMGGGFDNTVGSGGGGPVGTPEVFGHSDTKLYKLNPDTKEVGVVGTFSGCTTAVIDIALDKDSNLYGTTRTEGSDEGGLYAIDRVTAKCTLIKAGSYPNSLSFVPAGTLDPNVEALVGFLDNQYVRINPTTGAVSNVGAPWNNDFVSSGDVVSVKNGPSYLTIKDAPGAPNDVCGDCLVQIDPKTGAILQNYGSLGYSKVFGTAFWAGSVYGFTDAGELFEITITGNSISTSPITTPTGLSFWGAGSTTSAPPVPQ